MKKWINCWVVNLCCRGSISIIVRFVSDVKPFGKTIFDLAGYAVSNILMPLGVLLVSIFVPLKMKKDVLMKELGVSKNKGYKLFVLWLFLLRILHQLRLIIIVFLNVLGII